MTEFNAEAIAQLQRSWDKVHLHNYKNVQHYMYALMDICTGLENMGLDLEQDATYELLDPDLSKKKFDETYTALTLYSMLDQYHRAQQMTENNYLGGFATDHYIRLGELIDRHIPYFEQAFAKTGMPDGISPIHAAETALIMDMSKNGLLAQEYKMAANEAATWWFRTATTFYERAMEEESKGETPLHQCREGEAYANAALEAIEKAGEYYKPGEVPMKTDGFGGWKEDKGMFSRETLEGYQRYFFLKETAIKFKQARKFHDDGDFVLDASGSGHGMMVMPMQEMMMELEERGFDIRDPQTFTQIGTDIDTFWDCYQKERQAVSQEDKYNLMKPELKR